MDKQAIRKNIYESSIVGNLRYAEGINMATIDDVAKIAGVSRMTVSRVINDNGYVGKDTRIKILNAIEELKYSPNMIARSLVTKKSSTIAYVMANISDPFHNILAKSIESVCYKNGCTLMMCDTHSISREEEYINMIKNRFVDGVIFHHLAISKEKVKDLEKSGVKCVLLDNEFAVEEACCVNTDNYYGGRLAAEYLIKNGHTKIGCIYGTLKKPKVPKENTIAYEDTFQFHIWKERTKGFKDVLTEHGLDTRFMYQGNGLLEQAPYYMEKALHQVLQLKEKPTAFYCENDAMAVTMLRLMQEKGFQPIRDFSLIGHDGLEMCRMIHPFITTVEQPRYEMGQAAATVLLERIRGKQEPAKIVLKPTIFEGETVSWEK